MFKILLIGVLFVYITYYKFCHISMLYTHIIELIKQSLKCVGKTIIV